VAIITAGTSDQAVAEEAAETLMAGGIEVDRIYDVGVAGIHRLFEAMPRIERAPAAICIAGMEGALPSVLGGLVRCPVVAVPTSVGYGAALQGMTALGGNALILAYLKESTSMPCGKPLARRKAHQYGNATEPYAPLKPASGSVDFCEKLARLGE
jgi:phosphoribosylcarboxyaminoimidazole (NCAIR) mutase